MEKKVVKETSTVVLGFVMQEAFKEGWLIDEDMPLVNAGFNYEVGFVREFQADRPAPKLTPAERMAKARAGRKPKGTVAEKQ